MHKQKQQTNNKRQYQTLHFNLNGYTFAGIAMLCAVVRRAGWRTEVGIAHGRCSQTKTVVVGHTQIPFHCKHHSIALIHFIVYLNSFMES